MEMAAVSSVRFRHLRWHPHNIEERCTSILIQFPVDVKGAKVFFALLLVYFGL